MVFERVRRAPVSGPELGEEMESKDDRAKRLARGLEERSSLCFDRLMRIFRADEA